LSKNRIMVNRNYKGEIQCEVLSSTQERKSKAYVVSKRQKYYLRHNQFTDDIPIGVAFRAMGFESDQVCVCTVICLKVDVLVYRKLSA
jgi:DNA-directed RNA polymerase III subunit RPC2